MISIEHGSCLQASVRGSDSLAYLPRRQVVLPADPRAETCLHDPYGARKDIHLSPARPAGVCHDARRFDGEIVRTTSKGLSVQMSAAGGAAHIPVMPDEVTTMLSPALQPGPDSAVVGSGSTRPALVDCTLGLGGHAEALLMHCPRARLIGLDRDEDALAAARDRLRPFADRTNLIRARFDELESVMSELGVTDVQAILFDLGLSSLQIDRNDRGFAYATDVPLDMRMDRHQDMTAADVVAGYSHRELSRVLSTFGQERHAGRIAAAIVDARAKRPIRTSAELVDIIVTALPVRVRHDSNGHPAKRTFQALRIEVNDELDSLRRALPAAIAALGMGGRIAVLAYHSLEDRISKQTLGAAATDRAPRGLPVVPEDLQPELRLLTSKAVRPSSKEQHTNPRAGSARLRAAARIRPRRQERDRETAR